MIASAFGTAWWQWMTAMVWQSTLLIVGIAVAARLLRGRAWPELLHGLWLLVAIKLILPPTLASPWRDAIPASPATADAASTPSGMPSLVPYLAACWAVGALALLAAHALRHRRFRRLALATSRPASDRVAAVARRAATRLRLKRSVAVRELAAPGPIDGLDGAFALGCLRPLVFVSGRWARELDDEELEHVLLHELAHVRRGDLWVESLFAVVQGVYWFHPLVAYARWRCRAAREMACDAAVARCLGGPESYRKTLLALGAAPLATASGGLLISASLFERRSLLLARLNALEQAPRSAWRLRRVATGLLVLAAAIVALPLAAPVTGDLGELGQARAELERLAAGGEEVGSMHLRWAAARVQALEAQVAAGPPGSP